MPDLYGNPDPYDPNSGTPPVYPAGFVENFGFGSNYTEAAQDVIYHTNPVIESFVDYSIQNVGPPQGPPPYFVATPESHQPHVQNLGFDEPVIENWLEVDTTNEP